MAKILPPPKLPPTCSRSPWVYVCSWLCESANKVVRCRSYLLHVYNEKSIHAYRYVHTYREREGRRRRGGGGFLARRLRCALRGHRRRRQGTVCCPTAAVPRHCVLSAVLCTAAAPGYRVQSAAPWYCVLSEAAHGTVHCVLCAVFGTV